MDVGAGGGGLASLPQPLRLNLGCGTKRIIGWVNIDLYGDPDLRVDLERDRLPYPDGSVDEILASHVLEHLQDWWSLFLECARVLRPGGKLVVRVPDHTNTRALTPRDHHHVFGIEAFHGVARVSAGAIPLRAGHNSWAADTEGTVPLEIVGYVRTPYEEYYWIARWLPRLFAWLAYHCVNFVWDQIITFRKIGGANG